MVGLVLIVLGLIAMVAGGTVTRRSVQRTYGQVNAQTMMQAQGRGVTPKGAMQAVLVGFLLVVAGIVALVAVWVA